MTDRVDGLLLGAAGTREVRMRPAAALKHGFVAGAPGTGKTTTVQVLAEAFSEAGVPVFATDVGAELAGMSRPGGGNAAVEQRVDKLKLGAAWIRDGYPVVLWDPLGSHGHPVRVTVTQLGPLLLSRMLGLNDTQEAVLTVTFRVAHENALPLLDTRDLRAMLKYAADNASAISTTFGGVSAASIGTVQRALLQFEERGGVRLLGEPALDVLDLVRTDERGRGVVNLLATDRLITSRGAYSALLIWLLSELRDRLPEAADPQKPALVVLIDDAGLLFEGAPQPLIDTVDGILRALSRRGVGVFFATENPVDLPERIVCHLGNKVLHALRDYTPRDERRVTAAVELLRTNPAFMAEIAVTALASGEALVSVVADDGSPSKAERTIVVPPRSHLGPIAEEARLALVASSPIAGRYDAIVDRESAYEVLKARAEEQAAAAAVAAEEAAQAKAALEQARLEAAQARAKAAAERAARTARGRGDQLLDAASKSAVRTMGNQVGRTIIRGILGAIIKTGVTGS